MNCANHPQVPATAFCRTCGKALCDECKRDVRGVIYCEDCIVARLGDTMPPAAPAGMPYVAAAIPGAPNPALAAILGCIPFGIGAVYNGQYAKAVAHLITFAVLVVASDSVHDGPADAILGLAIAFFVIYQIFDAYRTAKAKQLGLTPPDPGGIYRSLGIPTDDRVGAPVAGQAAGAPAQRIPTAAVVLIGLGFLFLLHNMGWVYFHWMWRLWPLILIAIGVRLFMRNRPAGS